MVALNVAALTSLTSLLLPAMVGRKFGRILNVASLAAFQPLPSMAVYAATKAYVLSLTESLSELRGTAKVRSLPRITQHGGRDQSQIGDRPTHPEHADLRPRRSPNKPTPQRCPANHPDPGLPSKSPSLPSHPRWLTRTSPARQPPPIDEAQLFAARRPVQQCTPTSVILTAH
jgi:hypothetical protein